MATLTKLNKDQIQDILSKSRSRGQYDTELGTFMEQGEVGVQVDLTSGPFAEKKPQTIKTGFENAIKRDGAPDGSDKVAVRVVGADVFLIRTDLV